MNTAELQTIIRSLQEFRTDLLHVEAKRAEAELPRKIWETLSAFSNTPGGGVLILGLDESAGFALTGVRLRSPSPTRMKAPFVLPRRGDDTGL